VDLVVLPEAGHAVHIDEPAKMAQWLLAPQSGRAGS
jgi:hypothetical protein